VTGKQGTKDGSHTVPASLSNLPQLRRGDPPLGKVRVEVQQTDVPPQLSSKQTRPRSIHSRISVPAGTLTQRVRGRTSRRGQPIRELRLYLGAIRWINVRAVAHVLQGALIQNAVNLSSYTQRQHRDTDTQIDETGPTGALASLSSSV
jgi:hypothetical protein